MTAADYVVCVVAVAVAMSFSFAWMPMLAASVRYGWRATALLWRRPESVPRVYRSMRERNGLPDWPAPPKVAPPPSYRDPAPRTVEDRLDALERAEAARTLREMVGEAEEYDVRLNIAALEAMAKRHELRDDVDEFERSISEGATR